MTLVKKNGGLRTRSFFPRASFLDDFFSSDFPAFDLGNGSSSEWIPAANVKEGEKEFSVELSVPGYAKKDIHVEVDNNNALRITGKREDESEEETDSYTRKEFSCGSFTRSFQLPETINEEKIVAKCNNGVLKIELPKMETAILQKKIKEIEIN